MTSSNIVSAPKPRCDEELALLSLWYFGAPLRLETLRVYGNTVQYEVEQAYSDYHKPAFLGAFYTSYSCEGYDSSRDFWRHVLGELYCGGIARASYGQATMQTHRDKARIEQWIEYRRDGRSNSPRQAFERLAADVGGGERASIRGRRQVSYGREDAA